MYKNFVTDCIEKDLPAAQVGDMLDDYVEYWHTHETGLTLREFLGFTESEYEDWARNGDVVVFKILCGRRNRKDGLHEKD